MIGRGKHRHVQYWGVLGLLNLLLLLILTGCSSSEPDEGFEHQYEILGELFDELPPETQKIEFGDVPEFAHHLITGWSGSEEELRWTDSKTAEISFYHTGVNTDLELDVHWAAIASAKKKRQRTKVFLNGKKVKSVTVRTAFRHQTLRLPASKLLPGLNVLTFQFSYTESPTALDPDSQDERELAVAFKSIRFSSETSQDSALQSMNQQEFVQKANSAFGGFYEFPSSFALDVEYRSSKGMKTSLELVDEKGKVWKLALPSDTTRITKVFSLPNKGLYRVHVICRGPAGGEFVWKNVRLRTHTTQNIPETPEQGFVKAAESNAELPNILLYVIDTLRADHMGSYGYERDTTPQIDTFASENARYQNAYATSSWTKPSGASILSGLLPRNHHTTGRPNVLPDELLTLTEILREQGYHTAAFLTNGTIAGNFGFEQGFDDFIVFPENFDVNWIHTRAATVNERVFVFLNEYLEQSDRKPLFLFFWSTDPHDPYTPPEEFQQLFDIERFTPVDTRLKLLSKIRYEGFGLSGSQMEYIKARYDQEIFSNDHAFGELLAHLKTIGWYERMMVILTADHGEEFFEHRGVGHGLTLYNEQIRIPLVIKNSKIPPGVYDELVQLTDIYPTILDTLDVASPYALDGTSLNDAGRGHTTIYAEQNLEGNILTARIDAQKKIILNQQYFRPPFHPVMPAFEVYDARDLEELEQNEFVEGFEDYVRLQDLAHYVTTQSGLGFQQSEMELSPELDQKLRDLGYVN